MYKNVFFKVIGNACISWWCFWSNIRFKKAIRKNIALLDEDKQIKSIIDITKIVDNVYKKFKWTSDGIDQLFDAITPPPQNYQHYVDGLLKDDCDGFHSSVYHILHNNNLLCCLLTTNAINGGHCVLLFKFENKWYINDYKRIYGGNIDIEKTIKDYNEIYQKLYKSKKVLYNGLVRYDYEKGKFYKETLKNLKTF